MTLTANSRVTGAGYLEFFGTVAFGTHTLKKEGSGTLQFTNAVFTSSGSGALAVEAGTVVLEVAGTQDFNGSISVAPAGTLSGTLRKTEGGSFSAEHFRVGTISIESGTLSVQNDGNYPETGNNSGSSTSYVNAIAVGGVSRPHSCPNPQV